MTYWNHYHTPSSVEQALTLLTEYGDDAQIIAGGTDLILEMQEGRKPAVDALIDVTAIPGITDIQESDGWIVLGAGVTHGQIERSHLIRRTGTCLQESCSVVGGPQVRNVATLGGNVAHALPAADGTIGLLALNAEVQVCTLNDDGLDCSWRPLLSIFAGLGKNNLARNQLLSAFRYQPTEADEGCAFDRIMRPQGVALPILGLAARLRMDARRERVIEATIAIGPAGPSPFRATEAEDVLTSATTFDDEVLNATVLATQAQAGLRTSKHRASKEYRHEMMEVLLQRVLNRAVERARLEP